MEEEKNIHQEDPLEKVVQQAENESAEMPKKGKRKRSPVERFLRFVCILLFSPILLFLVLTLLLYVPFVQDWAVGIACEKISEATGLDVEVERLRISFPLDVDLQGLCITDPHGTLQNRATEAVGSDTILAVNSCLVDLDLCGLFGGKIAVDALDMDGVQTDTKELISTLIIKGSMESFHLDVHDLEFQDKRVNITRAQLSGCDLDIALRDTTVIDTTTSQPLDWYINFGPVDLKDVHLTFHTVRDTMVVEAGVQHLSADKGGFDLSRNHLSISELELDADSLRYDMTYQPRSEGLDPNHLVLYDLSTRLTQLDCHLDEPRISLKLPKLTLREKSGLKVDELSADLFLDSTRICVSKASFKTPSSTLRVQADVEWAALNAAKDGKLTASVSADLSPHDVMLLAGAYLPAELKAKYPNKMLTAEVDVVGNTRHLDVEAFRVSIPGMIDAKVRGNASHLLEDGKLAADLEWDVHATDLSLIKQIAGLDGIKLPAMDLSGSTSIAKDLYKANLLLRQGNGQLSVNGSYNPHTESYKALLSANNFCISNFVPMDSACVVTANAKVDGRGFDPFSQRTHVQALVDMPFGRYGHLDIGKLHLDGRLHDGDCWVNFYSGGDIVDADGCVELQLARNRRVSNATFSFDMRGLDLYALGVTKKPFRASMTMHMQGNTDLRQEHYLKGDVSAMQLALKDTVFYPRDIRLETLLNPDTTYAFLSAGDLLFKLNSTDGITTLIEKTKTYADSVTHQMETRQFDQQRLTAMLPRMDLCIQSGNKNPAANLLHSMMGYTYNDLDIDLHTDPLTGINAEGAIHSTSTGKIVLDTITFDLRQNELGTRLNARVCNNKRNKDVTFDARLQADLNPGTVNVGLLYFDSQNRKGVDLGAEVRFHNGERSIHLTPLRPVLAYRNFQLNDDNYLLLHRDGRLDANFDMVADDGTGLKLFSTPNEEAEQDLTLSLNQLNLGELCAIMPYMPRITGFLNGDLHFIQQDKVPSVMADLMAHNMAFEGTPMGNIGVNAAYMPNSDGSHYVDGLLTHNTDQILSFNGTYADLGTTDNVDASVTLENFPLALANGFLGETMQLTGNLQGDLTVRGSTSKPRVDGLLRTDGMHILSPLYSVDMRVEDDNVLISNSQLQLNQLKGYTTGTVPLTLDGQIDFAQLDRISLDVRAKAKNFELINAPKNRKAVAYGKVYVDLDARARGTLQNLSLTGNLGVLGNTNVTYVLLDSPITVEDEMSDLVTFVDFSDTLEVEEPVVAPPSNLRMNMRISIDQACVVNCLLSQDGASYMKLEGGGDLNMTYDALKGLQLAGRYTILQGKMTYNLMVVSLKDCEIKNGSYVEFNGDLSNPHLKIDASERVNSTITENGSPRTVPFDVGLSISQTLSNMGLAFTLNSPEDMNVQNQIAQMTDEQRSRVAVMLMTTGIYLIDGQEPGQFDTTNALNTFLQSQISSITGKALSSFDLSLGVQNNATKTGSMTTDYSFRFAKRFWGNRISLIVGGKVSSGADAQNTGESIIDNVSIEYRLDKSATRYVNLFYNANNESVLEGRIIEMGAGLVLRRKTNHLGELFLFRNSKKEENETNENSN